VGSGGACVLYDDGEEEDDVSLSLLKLHHVATPSIQRSPKRAPTSILRDVNPPAPSTALVTDKSVLDDHSMAINALGRFSDEVTQRHRRTTELLDKKRRAVEAIYKSRIAAIHGDEDNSRKERKIGQAQSDFNVALAELDVEIAQATAQEQRDYQHLRRMQLDLGIRSEDEWLQSIQRPESRKKPISPPSKEHTLSIGRSPSKGRSSVSISQEHDYDDDFEEDYDGSSIMSEKHLHSESHVIEVKEIVSNIVEEADEDLDEEYSRDDPENEENHSKSGIDVEEDKPFDSVINENEIPSTILQNFNDIENDDIVNEKHSTTQLQEGIKDFSIEEALDDEEEISESDYSEGYDDDFTNSHNTHSHNHLSNQLSIDTNSSFKQGDKVQIWWEDEQAWFTATVRSVGSGGACVLYDDGEEEDDVSLSLLKLHNVATPSIQRSPKRVSHSPPSKTQIHTLDLGANVSEDQEVSFESSELAKQLSAYEDGRLLTLEKISAKKKSASMLLNLKQREIRTRIQLETIKIEEREVNSLLKQALELDVDEAVKSASLRLEASAAQRQVLLREHAAIKGALSDHLSKSRVIKDKEVSALEDSAYVDEFDSEGSSEHSKAEMPSSTNKHPVIDHSNTEGVNIDVPEDSYSDDYVEDETSHQLYDIVQHGEVVMEDTDAHKAEEHIEEHVVDESHDQVENQEGEEGELEEHFDDAREYSSDDGEEEELEEDINNDEQELSDYSSDIHTQSDEDTREVDDKNIKESEFSINDSIEKDDVMMEIESSLNQSIKGSKTNLGTSLGIHSEVSNSGYSVNFEQHDSVDMVEETDSNHRHSTNVMEDNIGEASDITLNSKPLQANVKFDSIQDSETYGSGSFEDLSVAQSKASISYKTSEIGIIHSNSRVKSEIEPHMLPQQKALMHHPPHISSGYESGDENDARHHMSQPVSPHRRSSHLTSETLRFLPITTRRVCTLMFNGQLGKFPVIGLLTTLGDFLKVSDGGEIQLLSLRAGSVIIDISLPSDLASLLMDAARDGSLGKALEIALGQDFSLTKVEVQAMGPPCTIETTTSHLVSGVLSQTGSSTMPNRIIDKQPTNIQIPTSPTVQDMANQLAGDSELATDSDKLLALELNDLELAIAAKQNALEEAKKYQARETLRKAAQKKKEMLLAEAAQLEQELLLLRGAVCSEAPASATFGHHASTDNIVDIPSQLITNLVSTVAPTHYPESSIGLNDWLNHGKSLSKDHESKSECSSECDSFLSSSGAIDSDDQVDRRKSRVQKLTESRAVIKIQLAVRSWMTNKRRDRQYQILRNGAVNISDLNDSQMDDDKSTNSFDSSDQDESIELNLAAEVEEVRKIALQRQHLLRQQKMLNTLKGSRNHLEGNRSNEASSDEADKFPIQFIEPKKLRQGANKAEELKEVSEHKIISDMKLDMEHRNLEDNFDVTNDKKEKVNDSILYNIGDQVEVWWEDEEEWFAGVVTNVGAGKLDVRYDDGEVEEGVDARLVRISPLVFELLLAAMDVMDVTSDVQLLLKEDIARGIEITKERVSIVRVVPGSTIVSLRICGFSSFQDKSSCHDWILQSVLKGCLLPSSYGPYCLMNHDRSVTKSEETSVCDTSSPPQEIIESRSVTCGCIDEVTNSILRRVLSSFVNEEVAQVINKRSNNQKGESIKKDIIVEEDPKRRYEMDNEWKRGNECVQTDPDIGICEKDDVNNRKVNQIEEDLGQRSRMVSEFDMDFEYDTSSEFIFEENENPLLVPDANSATDDVDEYNFEESHSSSLQNLPTLNVPNYSEDLEVISSLCLPSEIIVHFHIEDVIVPLQFPRIISNVGLRNLIAKTIGMNRQSRKQKKLGVISKTCGGAPLVDTEIKRLQNGDHLYLSTITMVSETDKLKTFQEHICREHSEETLARCAAGAATDHVLASMGGVQRSQLLEISLDGYTNINHNHGNRPNLELLNETTRIEQHAVFNNILERLDVTEALKKLDLDTHDVGNLLGHSPKDISDKDNVSVKIDRILDNGSFQHCLLTNQAVSGLGQHITETIWSQLISDVVIDISKFT